MSPEVVGGRRGVSGDGAGAGAGAGVSAGGGGAGSRWGGGFATGLAQPASKARSSRGRRWRSILPSLTSVESRLNDNTVSDDIDLPGPFPYIRALPVEPRTPPSAPEIQGHEGQKLAQVAQDASPRLQARAPQGRRLHHQQDQPALQSQAGLTSSPMSGPKAVIWDVGNVIVRWNPRTLYSQVFSDPYECDRF